MRLGIVIELGELEDLMKIYIDEKQADMGQQLTLSLFLRWLSKKVDDGKRKVKENGKAKDDYTSPSNQRAFRPNG